MKIFGASTEEAELEMHAVTTEGANLMEGTKMKNGELNTSRTDSPAASATKMSKKKQLRERSASVSSHDSISDGSYTGAAIFDLSKDFVMII